MPFIPTISEINGLIRPNAEYHLAIAKVSEKREEGKFYCKKISANIAFFVTSRDI